MGTYQTVAVGYYLDIPPIKKNVTEKVLQCQYNCGRVHKEHQVKVGQFCIQCGGMVSSFDQSAEDTMMYFHQFIHNDKSLSGYDDFGFTPEYRSSDSFHTLQFHDGDVIVTMKERGPWEITEESLKPFEIKPKVKAQIDKFLTAFKKVYGEDSISLKFGVYCYYH